MMEMLRGEQERGQRVLPAPRRGLPGLGAVGAVWHWIQQVAPGPSDLWDPREWEWGSFLGNRQPF